MLRYQLQRNIRKQLSFIDFGDVTDNTTFEKMVVMYEQICKQDERKSQVLQMYVQDNLP
jgi:hypothetical protein